MLKLPEKIMSEHPVQLLCHTLTIKMFQVQVTLVLRDFA
jgi:hypothetical protein